MLKLCASLGFAFMESADGPTVKTYGADVA
jgi:hypothetical protein